MSAAPFDVSSIVARLRSCVPKLIDVGMAADYAAVQSLQDFRPPCAYVILASEQGALQPQGHAPRGQQVRGRQIVQVTFGVVLAVRNYREQKGAQVNDELREMLAATREALMGFVPDAEGARAIQFVRGDLMDYNAGTAIWADVYQTQHSIGN
jgi:hypothetical protein